MASSIIDKITKHDKVHVGKKKGIEKIEQDLNNKEKKILPIILKFANSIGDATMSISDSATWKFKVRVGSLSGGGIKNEAGKLVFGTTEKAAEGFLRIAIAVYKKDLKKVIKGFSSIQMLQELELNNVPTKRFYIGEKELKRSRDDSFPIRYIVYHIPFSNDLSTELATYFEIILKSIIYKLYPNNVSSWLTPALLETFAVKQHPSPVNNVSEKTNTTNTSKGDYDLDEHEFRKVLARRRQSPFRKSLLKAYGACAITGCEVEEALEAAHIVPHSQKQSYKTTDGILLRSDIHRLFDQFKITINPKTFKVEMAKSCISNYSKYLDKEIRRPDNTPPSVNALKKHYKEFLRLNQ